MRISKHSKYLADTKSPLFNSISEHHEQIQNTIEIDQKQVQIIIFLKVLLMAIKGMKFQECLVVE